MKPNPRYEINNLVDFALVSSETLEHLEPWSFEEAMNDLECENWKDVMKEEMKSLIKIKLES